MKKTWTYILAIVVASFAMPLSVKAVTAPNDYPMINQTRPDPYMSGYTPKHGGGAWDGTWFDPNIGNDHRFDYIMDVYALIEKGKAESVVGNSDAAIKDLNCAYELASKNGDVPDALVARKDLAFVYSHSNRTDQLNAALQIYDQLVSIHERSKDRRELQYAEGLCIYATEVAERLHDSSQAIRFFNRAINMATTRYDGSQLINYLAAEREFYRRQGNLFAVLQLNNRITDLQQRQPRRY